MPPGKHSITPMDHATGEPVDVEVAIDASVIDLLNEEIDRVRDASGADLYIDFNHDDAEASGWVKSFYWGGNDPLTGGVRAKIEWSDAGKRALQGKMFKRFSPTFRQEGGRVTGLGSANVGGLVNRPAFTNNEPVAAKDHQQKETEMDEEKLAAAVVSALQKNRIVNAMDSDEKKEMDALKAEMAEVKKENAELKKAQAKSAKDEEDRKTEAAQALVEQAVSAGAVAPKDDKAKALLVEAAKANPEAVQMLISAKGAQPGAVQAGLTVVPQSQGAQPALTQFGVQQQITGLVGAKKSQGMSTDAAYSAVQAERPDLFTA